MQLPLHTDEFKPTAAPKRPAAQLVQASDRGMSANLPRGQASHPDPPFGLNLPASHGLCVWGKEGAGWGGIREGMPCTQGPRKLRQGWLVEHKAAVAGHAGSQGRQLRTGEGMGGDAAYTHAHTGEGVGIGTGHMQVQQTYHAA